MKDSIFFGPQQGQQTINLELWSKPFVVTQSGIKEFVQKQEMFFTCFHHSWSSQLNLFSSTLGMVLGGPLSIMKVW